MTAASTQPYTVIGLTLDVDNTELLIAGVLPGAVADQIEVLSTSEEHFTRWAQEFDVPDADTAAALAYEQCTTAGHYVQRALAEAGIASYEDGHASADCFWITVETPNGGQIWVSGLGNQENQVDYPPAAHRGWLVCSYPDPDDSSVFSVLHEGSSTDLAADTAAAVDAIRAKLGSQARTHHT
ncbi:hypothetical protein AB0H07_46525 [Streptomyces sp. NPDC021354]|uniref:hypothetical protein n=1 Tax=Streptomyces sp. NPDC021354 TaxID=3154793 RepID=UPI0033DE312B